MDGFLGLLKLNAFPFLSAFASSPDSAIPTLSEWTCLKAGNGNSTLIPSFHNDCFICPDGINLGSLKEYFAKIPRG